MSDATIEIKKKYKELGGRQGFLGAPINTPSDSDGLILGTTAHQHYQHGVIYYSQETGAHEVHGAIQEKYDALPEDLRCKFGLPISDEILAPGDYIRYSRFQGGTIIWSREAGAQELHGKINKKWLNLTEEVRRTLGNLNTDQFPTPDGAAVCNHFSNGAIYHTNNYGTRVIYGRIYAKWRDLGWENGRVNGSTIGYPMTDVTMLDLTGCAAPGGEQVTFPFVRIFARRGYSQAYTVGGGFLTAFQSSGGEHINGFPQSDSFPSAGGYLQSFECSMLCSKTGCGMRLIPRQIFGYYMRWGSAAGCLGFPRTDYILVSGTSDHWYQLFEHGRIDYNVSTETATVRCDTTGGGSSTATRETDVLLEQLDFIGGLEHYRAVFLGRAIRLQNNSGRALIFVKYNPNPEFAVWVLHHYAERNTDGSLVVPENNYILVPHGGSVNATELRLPDHSRIDAGLISLSGGGGRDGARSYSLHIVYQPL